MWIGPEHSSGSHHPNLIHKSLLTETLSPSPAIPPLATRGHQRPRVLAGSLPFGVPNGVCKKEGKDQSSPLSLLHSPKLPSRLENEAVGLTALEGQA